MPDCVEIDHDKLKGTFLRQPQFAEIPYTVQMQPNPVIEYHSR